MNWTAILPLKPLGERKSRLAAILPDDERARLSIEMFDHVVRVLSAIPAIGRIVLLSGERLAGWTGAWRQDLGRGLNIELQSMLDEDPAPIAIIHPDLPLLQTGDVRALLRAAEARGVALAPDRHRTGTNALAMVADRRIPCLFGAESFAKHRGAAEACMVVDDRVGLCIDCDTPDDLELIRTLGWTGRSVPEAAPAAHAC